MESSSSSLNALPQAAASRSCLHLIQLMRRVFQFLASLRLPLLPRLSKTKKHYDPVKFDRESEKEFELCTEERLETNYATQKTTRRNRRRDLRSE